MLPHL